MSVERYNGSEYYTAWYTGAAFGYTKEQNREALIQDINETLNKDDDNNMKLISREIEKYGGYECQFHNGCKDAIILGALTTNEDYYYLYWDIQKKELCTNTGCDSIIDFWKGRHEGLSLDTIKIDEAIDQYLQKNYWYEVPFTKIYKSDSWKFPFIKSSKRDLLKDIDFSKLFK